LIEFLAFTIPFRRTRIISFDTPPEESPAVAHAMKAPALGGILWLHTHNRVRVSMGVHIQAVCVAGATK
jgi:hypothetical protein